MRADASCGDHIRASPVLCLGTHGSEPLLAGFAERPVELHGAPVEGGGLAGPAEQLVAAGGGPQAGGVPLVEVGADAALARVADERERAGRRRDDELLEELAIDVAVLAGEGAGVGVEVRAEADRGEVGAAGARRELGAAEAELERDVGCARRAAASAGRSGPGAPRARTGR